MENLNGAFDHSEAILNQGLTDSLGIDWSETISGTKNEAGAKYAFYYDGKLNQAKTTLQGHPVYDPVIYFLTESLDGLTKTVKEATKEHIQRCPKEWMAFQKTQKKVEGFPLEKWPGITRPQYLNLKACDIHSLEDLAGVPMSQLQSMGQEGRILKEQAIAYFAVAKDAAVVQKQAKRIVELESEIQILRNQVSEIQRAADARMSAIPSMPVMPQPAYAPLTIDTEALKESLKKELLAAMVGSKPKAVSAKKRGRPKKVVTEISTEETVNETL